MVSRDGEHRAAEHDRAADDAELLLEVSTDLGVWDANGIMPAGSVSLPGGNVQSAWQLSSALYSGTRIYLRARAALRP